MNEYLFKNLSILVTGGSGFIGSHLAEKLVDLGANVTILDNLQKGKLENLSNIFNKINFINGDITNFNICLEATKNQNIVFHLAAFVSVSESMEQPIECNKINIQGTLNLLEASRINNVNKFIFSSSSAVYGNKNETCNEDDECKPTSVYGYSKFIGEILCKQYSELFGLKTICLRYFNVYGQRQDPNGQYAGVIAKFSDSMKNNKSIIIYGNGKQTRDFIAVEKVVEANLKLAMLPIDKFNGQFVNIASGKSITLLELIENLKADFPNYNLKPIFAPERSGDILISKANCNKYHKLLT